MGDSKPAHLVAYVDDHAYGNGDAARLFEHIAQITRERDAEREAREKSQRAYRLKEDAIGVLMNRLIANNIDVSDLIS